MVRMKLSRDEFDPKKLDVKVEPSTFKRYRGEIPPNGTILIFRVTRMWWTQSKAGDSQIYLMAFAEQNEGKFKKFNGLPVREYLTFNPDSAFRYQPFLHNFGLTTRDIFNKMDVEPEPDKVGDIINSIGGWVVGSDDALCRIALVRDRYDPDELKAKVDKEGWLPYDEDDELDDDVDDEYDEDMQEEPEDEEDTPPARPARRSRTTQAPARGAKAASARRRGDPDEDEDEEDEYDDDVDDEEDDIDDEEEAEAEDQEGETDQEDDSEAEEEPPARTRRARSTSTRSGDTGRTTSTRPAARTTARGRGRTERTAPADGARRGSRTATRESSRAKRIKEDDPPF
jgi:hypothetical protein